MSQIARVRTLEDCWLLVCKGFSLALQFPEPVEPSHEMMFDASLLLVTSCCTSTIGRQQLEEGGPYVTFCDECWRDPIAGADLQDTYHTEAGALLMARLEGGTRHHNEPQVLRDWVEMSHASPLEQEIAYSELRQELEAVVVELISSFLEESHRILIRDTMWV